MNRGYALLWRKVWANPLLCEPGKKFSRLEAWPYIINALAAGKENEKTGLSRGEFAASSRYLATKWNWPRTSMQRFFRELEAAGMITRINTDLGHQGGQSAGRHEGHFIVQNYETYNPARTTDRAGSRAISRTNIKEVVKEGFKEVEKKDTHMPSADGDRSRRSANTRSARACAFTRASPGVSP